MMKFPYSTLPLILWIIALPLAFAQGGDNSPLGPDSQPQPGVPKGEVIHFTFDRSKIFPGTTRDVWLYVPAQYTPDQPACLYVNQDGIQFNAPTVFDNLIAKKEMPVTIGLFVMHGRVKAKDENAALDRFNRSYEYDGLGDGYARFILDELLPEVETMKTSDGRAIRISKKGSDHAIGGTSSGAICAFTAAWERPDAFTRVFSGIGTYVGLRGGDRYPTLVRKVESKPIRVFLQDGEHDQNIYAGDWWMANQMMERALTFAGYEVQHVWGEGSHNNNHAAALFPDAMRWLWKDWPQAVPAGHSNNGTLNEILIPGEGWQLVGEGYSSTGGIAANAKGEVSFNDAENGRTNTVGTDGKAESPPLSPNKAAGEAYGPDGRRYAIEGSKIVAYPPEGKPKTLAGGIKGHDLVVAHNGNLYVTQPGENGGPSTVWLIRPNGKKRVVDTGLRSASGIKLSPDQTLLYVAEKTTHWVYSYQIQPDGSLAARQPYYWLHVPDTAEDSGAESMAVDRDGRLYVATRMGVQVCDQAGRVNAILPLPNDRAGIGLSFGGPNFDTLFVTTGDRVYRRKLKILGAPAWDAPNKPGAPRL
jgi:predicted alpha/beta superfamily hydrolase